MEENMLKRNMLKRNMLKRKSVESRKTSEVGEVRERI